MQQHNRNNSSGRFTTPQPRLPTIKSESKHDLVSSTAHTSDADSGSVDPSAAVTAAPAPMVPVASIPEGVAVVEVEE
jgi:hypothetical protein